MDNEESLPITPLERRRDQLRRAQRRFREKRSQNRSSQAAQATTNVSTSDWTLSSQLTAHNIGVTVSSLMLASSHAAYTSRTVTIGSEIYPQGMESFSSLHTASDSELGRTTQPYFTAPISQVSVASGELSDSEIPERTRSTRPCIGSGMSASHMPFLRRKCEAQPSEASTPGLDCTTSLQDGGSCLAEDSSRANSLPCIRLDSTLYETDANRGSYQDMHNTRSERSANGETRDIAVKNWLSSLHIASHRGHTAIVQILLDRDVDVNECDSNGRSALHIATMQGYTDVVRILLQYGALVNATDNKGDTALHWAALHKNERLLEILVEAGAEVNMADNNGWTPLHVAVERGFEPGLRLLLRHGADVSMRAQNPERKIRADPCD